MSPQTASILAVLPQTQCTRCGYADCAAYAQAIADDLSPINQCPPGGHEGIERLAALTGKAVLQLNPENGQEGPRQTAYVDENWCIGCTRCIDVCPVDAIVGANKRMHTVIEPFCTGCELCLPVCPVDCIVLEPVSGHATGWAAWSHELASQAQQRYAMRQQRLWRNKRRPATASPRYQTSQAEVAGATLPDRSGVADRKKLVVEAALARARARRSVT